MENNNSRYVKVQDENVVRLHLELNLEGFIEEITEEIMCELSFGGGIEVKVSIYMRVAVSILFRGNRRYYIGQHALSQRYHCFSKTLHSRD